MARLRVHELAKELNVSPKELVDKMNELGIPCKNHMSILSTEDANYLRRFFKKFAKPSGRPVDDMLASTKRVIVRKRTRKEDVEVEEEEEQPEVEQESVPVEVLQVAPEETIEDEKVTGKTEEVVTSKVLIEERDMGPLQEATEILTSKSTDKEKTEPQLEVRSEIKDIKEEVTHGREREEPSLEVSSIEEVVVRPSETPILEEEAELDVAEDQGIPTIPTSEEALEVSEDTEEKRQRPKRHRRRRRRKPKKEEPAKIIQLPEFIPSTEEDHEEALEAKVRGRIIVDDEAPKKPVRPPKKFRTREDAKIDREEREIEAPPKFLKPKREEKEALKEVSETSTISIAKVESPVPGTLPPKTAKRKIRIEEAIIVSELAHQMGVKATEVIKKLLLLGLPVTVNQAIDFETASLVASEFGYEVEKKGIEEEAILASQEDRPEDLRPRPPVVTVMGHVDHGKTSLLDAIRHTNVTSAEAGGITQHIGAYHVHLEKGDIVFLDTPGHEAFTAMRARGAKVTDIVILVVAADDGVMQQTVEAINHAKAANVPIIVAINKIDKPNANPERVKRELSELGLIPEEWGGSTIMVEVSAKKKIGIEDLLEMVLLQAEIMELKANPNKAARGRVIEAKLEKGRGSVATVLIQEGTLRVGDAFVCGVHYGKVRNIFDDRGERIESAGPSMPVEVIGLSGVPQAGDDFAVVADEKQARTIAEHRLRKQREREISLSTKVTLEKLYEQIREGQLKELNLILKTDVQGSLEALTEAIRKLSHPEIKINIIHSATGAINETDIMLASASNAIVIGFNVRPDAKVEELAQREKIDVRFYNVIYQLIDDIKAAMVGLLEPEYQEKVLGRAEVRQTFHISKVGTVAGCYVLNGVVQRSAKVRVLRDQVVVYDGRIASLKRFKEDAREVKAGFECGILIENFNDIKVGDILEVYVMEATKPSIEGISAQETREDSQDKR
ncbi:MAG: translation initiation factor IF-2 [Syntrophobacterales bacterium]|nr:translation initiation factor IF-2 [Syntrophobacterales bacterium]